MPVLGDIATLTVGRGAKKLVIKKPTAEAVKEAAGMTVHFPADSKVYKLGGLKELAKNLRCEPVGIYMPTETKVFAVGGLDDIVAKARKAFAQARSIEGCKALATKPLITDGFLPNRSLDKFFDNLIKTKENKGIDPKILKMFKK